MDRPYAQGARYRQKQAIAPPTQKVCEGSGLQAQPLHMLCHWKLIPGRLQALSPSAVTLPCRWPRKEQRALEAPRQSPVRGCEQSPHRGSLLHLWSGAAERAASQLQNSRCVYHTSICLCLGPYPAPIIILFKSLQSI